MNKIHMQPSPDWVFIKVNIPINQVWPRFPLEEGLAGDPAKQGGKAIPLFAALPPHLQTQKPQWRVLCLLQFVQSQKHLNVCVCSFSIRHYVCAPSPSDIVCVLFPPQTCVCCLFQPIPAVPHYMLRLSPTQGRVAPRQRSEEPPACILPSLDYSDNKQPGDWRGFAVPTDTARSL